MMKRGWIAAVLVAGAAAAGCGTREVPPPPAPAAAPRPPAPRMGGDHGDRLDIAQCVVRNGQIENVAIDYYDAATGDSTVNGRPLREAFPDGPEYAGQASWYVNNEPVTVGSRRLVRYGLPRVMGATELVKVGTYLGVDLFAVPSETRPYQVVWAPVNPFCEFQPYQDETNVGPVRG